MIVFINIHMSIERKRHRRQQNHEQVQSHEQIAYADDHGDWHQKEQRIIIPVVEITGGNYMVSRIMSMVKLDMILEKPSAEGTMAEIFMK